MLKNKGTWFILSIMLFFGYILMLFVNMKSVQENYMYDVKTLRNLSIVTKSVLDMETGARGYFNTQQKEFLEPYWVGKNDAIPALIWLQSSSKDSEFIKALKEVQIQDTQWTTLSEQFITNPANLPSDQLRKLSFDTEPERKAIIDKIRLILKTYTEKTRSKADSDEADLNRSQQSLLISLFLLLAYSANIGYIMICGAEADRRENIRLKEIVSRHRKEEAYGRRSSDLKIKIQEDSTDSDESKLSE